LENDPKIIISFIGLLTVLLIALIFGRIHQSKNNNQKIKPLGDRVIAGLLAVPLISLILKLIFFDTCIVVLLAAPLPVFIYTAFLAFQDIKNAKNKFKTFTGGLFISVVASYVVIIVAILIFEF